MSFYSIGSLRIEAEALPHSYQPFLLRSEMCRKKSDLTIKQVSMPHSTEQLHKIAELSGITIWKNKLSNDCFRWVFEVNNGISALTVNANYTDAEFYCLDLLNQLFNHRPGEFLAPCFQMLLECKLLQNGFTVLHSACVELDGKAYAFTGPSGIGKSTRAQKWCDLLSAEWISGDRPAVDVSRGIVYGVPWDGKEGIYRNVSRPLAAILKVKRSESTMIKEMTEEEKLQLLCEQTFSPMWDPVLVANAFHSLRILMKSVPIYELCCDITDESTIKAHELIVKAMNSMKGEV